MEVLSHTCSRNTSITLVPFAFVELVNANIQFRPAMLFVALRMVDYKNQGGVNYDHLGFENIVNICSSICGIEDKRTTKKYFNKLIELGWIIPRSNGFNFLSWSKIVKTNGRKIFMHRDHLKFGREFWFASGILILIDGRKRVTRGVHKNGRATPFLFRANELSYKLLAEYFGISKPYVQDLVNSAIQRKLIVVEKKFERIDCSEYEARILNEENENGFIKYLPEKGYSISQRPHSIYVNIESCKNTYNR